MSVCYLSQVEESHRVAGVTVVDPAFLTRVVELHVADVSLACFWVIKKQTKKQRSAWIRMLYAGIYSIKRKNSHKSE